MWWDLVGGLVAGVVLYVATVVFMGAAGRWTPLSRHATALYDRRRELTIRRALAISVLVTSLGEELLWRGVVQGALGAAFGPLGAASLSWCGYVLANSVSGSLAIILGAVVGGAAWTFLAWATEGIVASMACHAVWTALMIVAPPVRTAAE